jgi:hypothetical protein
VKVDKIKPLLDYCLNQGFTLTLWFDLKIVPQTTEPCPMQLMSNNKAKIKHSAALTPDFYYFCTK